MNNVNYMDGVPVKIAENYKSPAPIYNLPQQLAHKLSLEDNFFWNCPLFSCDLQLEKKALTKIEQWKVIRLRNKEQRKERILRREQQRKRDDEVRQKSLLYSVSYPSTDDLSSEEEERGEHDIEIKKNGTSVSESKKIVPQIRVEQNVNTFDNILQPTVLSINSLSIANSAKTPLMNSAFDSKILNSFNYKDFEDDTSSPFDNIELKTINDLDVLAQVLHNTQIKSPAIQVSSEIETKKVSIDNCDEYNKTSSELKIKATEDIPKPNNNLPRFNYDFIPPPGTLTQLRDHNLTSASTIHYKENWPHSAVTPICHELNYSNGYFNFASNHYNQSIYKIDSGSPQMHNRTQALEDDQIVKSKSVPDILEELREEIKKSETRRYRNISCNMEDTSEHVDICVKDKTNDADTDDIFNQLDRKAQQLVEQITAMGFPCKRVARIVQLLGVDDKKVVEHLIPLSELADLGFEEKKISDALIRNENNKNKALEDLIS